MGDSPDCLTPGCKYYTRITSHDFKRSATFKLEVDLPGPLNIPETEDAIGGTKKRDKYLKEIEDILHRHLEAAVAQIGQWDRFRGGALAKDWPTPPATLEMSFDVGHEIGYRKGGAEPRTSLPPSEKGSEP